MVGVMGRRGLALGLTGNVEYVIGSCNIPPVVYEIGNILITGFGSRIISCHMSHHLQEQS